MNQTLYVGPKGHTISVVLVVAKVLEKLCPSNYALILRVANALVHSRVPITQASLLNSCYGAALDKNSLYTRQLPETLCEPPLYTRVTLYCFQSVENTPVFRVYSLCCSFPFRYPTCPHFHMYALSSVYCCVYLSQKSCIVGMYVCNALGHP